MKPDFLFLLRKAVSLFIQFCALSTFIVILYVIFDGKYRPDELPESMQPYYYALATFVLFYCGWLWWVGVCFGRGSNWANWVIRIMFCLVVLNAVRGSGDDDDLLAVFLFLVVSVVSYLPTRNSRLAKQNHAQS